MEVIRKNIRDFKDSNSLDRVIVLWTANTERFCKVIEGVHDSFENLMKGLEESHKEISASTVFAIASLLEGASFINGSPQNTFVPGVLTMKTDGFMVGNDFKTGQTKFKTNFIDFLLSAGIKPKSCISYNHLGNNDGKNLSQ
jgi:myo-inositol-1-phosphate synthase